MVAKTGTPVTAREHSGAAYVIAVLVSQQNAVEAGSVDPGRVQPPLELPAREAGIDQEPAGVGFDDQRVARATGAENRHPACRGSRVRGPSARARDYHSAGHLEARWLPQRRAPARRTGLRQYGTTGTSFVVSRCIHTSLAEPVINRGLSRLGRARAAPKEEPVMIESSTHVGLDVHKKQIAVALLRAGEEQPLEWRVVNEPRAIRRLARRIKRKRWAR